ncbi:MAG: hypothetical protein MUE44_30690 [Oscillatoriaceae cyanobacterium Prado104]|nr:hypothetical protein [Oscillatoriaceae cyanobacterium Prado104]
MQLIQHSFCWKKEERRRKQEEVKNIPLAHSPPRPLFPIMSDRSFQGE